MSKKDELVEKLALERPRVQTTYQSAVLAGIVVGACFVVAGFVLAILGYTGAIEIAVEGGGLNAKLVNAGPGVVFAFLGMIVLWRYKPQTYEKVEVNVEQGTYVHEQKMFSDAKEIDAPKRAAIGEPVVFVDDGVKKAVAEVLNKSIESEIGDLELSSITALNAPDHDIHHLDDMKWMPGLEILNLESNEIEDLEPLTQLSALRVLSLNMNPIQDLGPLTSLTGLERLFLGKCGLSDTDVTNLARIRVSNTLSIVYNQISDLTPFVQSETLSEGVELLVFGNPLSTETEHNVLPRLSARGVLFSAGSVGEID